MDRDILRIQDPDFHQPCQIVGGKRYDSKHDSIINEAIQEFKDNVHNKV